VSLLGAPRSCADDGVAVRGGWVWDAFASVVGDEFECGDEVAEVVLTFTVHGFDGGEAFAEAQDNFTGFVEVGAELLEDGEFRV
jgi:hypothetical protein